jgi:hypothetical protein
MGGLLLRERHRVRLRGAGVEQTGSCRDRAAAGAAAQRRADGDGDSDHAAAVPGPGQGAVGHGVHSWMGQVGARVGSPLSLLREYLTALRSPLDGQEAITSGRCVKLYGVSLEWPPLASPELLAGASGPLSLRLSGELANGTVLRDGD